jgi:hypothetical protein
MMDQLMFQNMMRQQALQQEQAAYSAEAERQRRAAEERVAAQQAALDAGIKGAIGKPVTLGTLLTSNSGLLGNPVLSLQKLSG